METANQQTISTSKILSHPPGKVRGNPVVVNPDGTITRLGPFTMVPATPDPSSSLDPVLTKDLPLNPHHNTFVRLFLPRATLLDTRCSTRLPLIVYFHAGAFLLFSAASPIFHNLCAQMAYKLGVVVASVNYRLAPEHRLPAAYDDALDALRLIAKKKDEWLSDFVDFSNCFLMGTSAGGNIVYHTGRYIASAENDEFEPLNIRGLIMLHSTFSGQDRTASELKFANDRYVSLMACDLVWELSLPIGVDRDHEYTNQMANGRGKAWAKLVSKLGWKVMFIGCNEDTFVDRQKELATVLQKEGVNVVSHFEKGCHNIELANHDQAKELFERLKKFMYLPMSTL